MLERGKRVEKGIFSAYVSILGHVNKGTRARADQGLIDPNPPCRPAKKFKILDRSEWRDNSTKRPRQPAWFQVRHRQSRGCSPQPARCRNAQLIPTGRRCRARAATVRKPWTSTTRPTTTWASLKTSSRTSLRARTRSSRRAWTVGQMPSARRKRKRVSTVVPRVVCGQDMQRD